MKCENCCYFGYSENPDYIRKDGTKIEHCLFRELRDDYETAPCDEEEPEEYEYDYEEDYESNCHCDTYGVCGGYSCRNYAKCHS